MGCLIRISICIPDASQSFTIEDEGLLDDVALDVSVMCVCGAYACSRSAWYRFKKCCGPIDEIDYMYILIHAILDFLCLILNSIMGDRLRT